MTDIVIGIPSFRRPESLERLLNAIDVLKTDAKVTVLIVDNDAEKREAVSVSAKISARGYRWPLDAVVKHPCDFIAMIDDDEEPDAGWLAEMSRVQAQTGADALNGQTRRVFERDPGGWAVHCDGVSDTFAPTGSIALIEGTGNLLARRSLFESMSAPWFDPAFGFTGGEDKDFFVRAKARGARFAWANDAIVYDHVPQSRANLKWALSRAYSAGNSDMRVFLKHRPSLKAQADEAARILAALLLNPILFVILAFDPNRRVRPLRKLCRAFGKIAAIAGRHYEEYSVIHGQ